MKVAIRTTIIATEEKTSTKGNRYLQFAIMDGTNVLQCYHNIEGSEMTSNGKLELPELFTPYTVCLDIRIGKYTKVEVISWKKAQ